ncbi:MAG: transporter substrate-binding domain-containing protein [Desulfobacterales bacterium]|nr:transporter substrate-binding domain-containing protein [Desulfobacterales bacterium]
MSHIQIAAGLSGRPEINYLDRNWSPLIQNEYVASGEKLYLKYWKFLIFYRPDNTALPPVTTFLLYIFLLFSPLLMPSPSPAIVTLQKGEPPPQIALTEQEIRWISNHSKIRVANEMDWPPLDFVETGEPIGYSIDLIRLLAGKLGLALEFVNGVSWSELLEKGKRREIDLFPVIVNISERRNFLNFTRPYLSIAEGLYVSETLKDKTSFSQMSGFTIAMVKDHAFEAELRKRYPEIIIMELSSLLEGLKSVANGTADGVVATKAVADYLITAHGIVGLHYHSNAGRALQDTEQELSIGTRNDMPVLNGLMQKALDALTLEERQHLHEKWFSHQHPSSIGLTREELRWLAEHPIIRISNEMDWAPFDFMQDGRPAGYAMDMMDHIADMLGVHFEYVNGLEWPQLLERFRNPEQEDGIDVMSAIYKTDKRNAYALFTKSYYKNPPVIITRKDENDINSLNDLAGRRVALPKDYAISEILPKEVPTVLILSEIDGKAVRNPLEALKAVVNGKADAVVESSALLAYHIETNALPDLKIAAYPWFHHHDIRDMDLYAAVRKDWPLFHSILGKAMKHIRPEIRQTWVKRWIHSSQLETAPIIALTKAEKAWLSEKEQIIYCVDPNWMPYEHINEKGEYEGMVADYVALASERTGLPFRLYQTGSWSQTIDEMRRGACDIIAAATPTASRRKWLDFTRPHLESALVIALRSEELFIENIAAIQNKTIGVVKGYAHFDLIREQYPNLEIQEVTDVVDGLRRVAEGELFGFVDTVASIVHTIRREGLLDLKIGGRFDISLKLAFAMRKGEDPELLSVLDKVAASFSEPEKQEISSKWFSVKFERGIDYTLIWQIVAGGLIVIAFFVFWNRKLSAEKAKTQKAYEDLSVMRDQLEEKNIALEELSVTDKLTGIYNRMKLDSAVTEEIGRYERYKHPFGIILLDIDHFKSVNDTYGHQVGDKVLQEIARLLTTYTRKSDLVGRWGGEEFLIICPEIDNEKLTSLSEKLRRIIATHSFPIVSSQTASFGVASYKESESANTLIHRADQALYHAKNSGRNKVCLG